MIYLNPKTYIYFRDKIKSENLNVEIIRYDGIYFVTLLRLFCNYKFGRNSFDFTSLAHKFFNSVLINNQKIEIYGGTDVEIKKFIDFLRKKYNGIKISEYDNGYHDDKYYLNKINSSNSENILIGLGSIRQENIVLNSNFKGKLITCGAFISQTANSADGNYYPSVYKKFAILWLYRILTEKNHWKRLTYYPKFTMYFFYDLVRMLFKLDYKK